MSSIHDYVIPPEHGNDNEPRWQTASRKLDKTVAVLCGLGLVVVLAAKPIYDWRVARNAEAARAAAEKEERAQEIRAEGEQRKTKAEYAQSISRDRDIEYALTQMQSRSPMLRCSAALNLARLEAHEQIQPLLDLMADDSAGSASNCAAGALVKLGVTEAPMARYMEWAESSDATLHRNGVMGFGDIGPSAAEVALPYLAEELKSPHMDARYVAVDTLSKLGPAARPLLLEASRDPDQTVRDFATAVLTKLR